MEDKLWNKAKRVVEDNKLSTDWATAIDIYHHLGGVNKRLYASILGGKTFRVVGRISQHGVLVVYQHEEKVELLDFSLVLKAKKLFTDNKSTEATIIDIPDYIQNEIDDDYSYFVSEGDVSFSIVL